MKVKKIVLLGLIGLLSIVLFGFIKQAKAFVPPPGSSICIRLGICGGGTAGTTGTVQKVQVIIKWNDFGKQQTYTMTTKLQDVRN